MGAKRKLLWPLVSSAVPVLCPLFQRTVHLLEAAFCVRAYHAQEQWGEYPGEGLALQKSHPVIAKRLGGEDMLAVEKAGTIRWPGQRNSWAGSALSTVGLNVMPRALEGWM